jgi:polyisoprenoid-binding protein YceI
MATWNLDAAHSEVQFKVKHMVISTVTGLFKEFNISLESSKDDFSDAKLVFTANVNSIDTRSEQRDGHLKSDDFFNAEKYPQITFKGKSFNGTKLTGDLTIRDVTKEITLDVESGGIIKDPWGNTRAGFEVHGVINRQDFGLKWGALTEAGGLVVADDVKISANVEFVKGS